MVSTASHQRTGAQSAGTGAKPVPMRRSSAAKAAAFVPVAMSAVTGTGLPS